MKLYITDIPYAAAHTDELRRLRLSGNMVALYSDRNRRSLMREYYTLANYFIADSGEFVFSGCFTLRAKRSAFAQQVISIFQKHGISYSFVREVENACGGQIPVSASGESVSNEHFNYAVRFSSDEQRKTVTEECRGLCTFHEEDGETYLIFDDISLEDAIADLLKQENISEDNTVQCSETDA